MVRVASMVGVLCGAVLGFAGPAWASDITVSATAVGASAVTVHVSGSADSCQALQCTSQSVQVELTPSSGDGDDSCIIPDAPQAATPISTAGGSFDFDATVPVEGGQTYAVCGYIENTDFGVQSTDTASAPALVKLPPGACPSGTSHAMSLQAPGTVAYGRHAVVLVDSFESLQTIANAKLVMSAEGAPFYTHALTRGELNQLYDDNGPIAFGVQLERGDGPAKIVLTDQQDQSDDSSAQCIDQRTVTVRPVPGTNPRARLSDSAPDDDSGAAVVFSAPGGCRLTRAVPALVTVRWQRYTWTLRSGDECRSGSWRAHGKMPGISSGHQVTDAGATISFHPVAPVNRTYQVTVKLAGTVVKQGALTSYYHFTPDKRIFEGTDAFVNYCIDTNKTIYSYHHRLFCWQPGSTQHFLSF